MNQASMTERVREYALSIARQKGWTVHPADCTVTPVSTADLRLSGQAAYWQVRIVIRAALNSHRSLTRNGLISGIVRLSGDSLLDTLTEAPETLQARLSVDGEF